MLTIWGDKQRYCDGINRRNFLQIGAFGAGLTLADVLRLQAAQEPGASLKRTANKAAIMIYLPGGPSHMDMWDLKPDAPKEFRGEFNPINTNVPGVQICEHMPMQARMWDKLAVRPLARLGRGAQRQPRDDRLQREHEPHRAAPVLRLGDVEAPQRQLERRAAVRLASRRRQPGHRAGLPRRMRTGRSLRAALASRTSGSPAASTSTAWTTARRCSASSTPFAARSTPAAP